MQHQALGHDAVLVERIATAARLLDHAKGEVLMLQDEVKNDVAFLLVGSAEVLVHERRVATRKAGDHVGEMAAIDPTVKRSATVRALESTCAAWVSEPDITAIANDHPALWRSFARELADRLRERGDSIRPPNAKPRVFLGSSVEGLTVANTIQAGLTHDRMSLKMWTNQTFAPSGYPLDDLLAESVKADFAVFLVVGDDMTTSRAVASLSPRDNIVLELGIFMGALGRARTLVVRPRGVELKIPSDLLGLNVIDYDATAAPEDLSSALGQVCLEIRWVVSKHGPR
jgi:predicted nucleotide-binding protein